MLVILCTPFAVVAAEVHGSGSTFAFPIVAKWADAYEHVTGVHIQYHPIGSSAGIREVSTGIVDFGLTDAPLVDAQLLRDGLTQFPLLIGAIVPVVNLGAAGAGQLHFSGQLLADIYLGKVKNWNDAAIAALNPGMVLPNQPYSWLCTGQTDPERHTTGPTTCRRLVPNGRRRLASTHPLRGRSGSVRRAAVAW